MKIICVANNFFKSDQKQVVPVFYLKPDTSILVNNRPFFIPHFAGPINFSVSPVIKINKVGKNIAEKFAHRYYSEITAGINFFAGAILEECKNNNHPWGAATSFEGSAPVGKFIKTGLTDYSYIFMQNDDIKHSFKLGELGFSFDFIISYISQFFTIKTGDFIFQGAPVLPGNININDRMKVLLNEEPVLDFSIK